MYWSTTPESLTLVCSRIRSVEEWQHVLNTNLSSCFYTSRLAVPLMLLEHSGRIINISSVWGNVGASMEVAYSASKGGV